MAFDDLVRSSHSAHPRVRLAVIEGTSISQVEALRSGRLDFCIIRATGAGTPFLSTKVLMREHMLMALPKSHPLAKSLKIRLAELSQDKFVLFAPAGPAPMHAMLVSACREVGFAPNFELEVQHQPSAVGPVASGDAVAMLPASLAAVRHRDGIFKRLVGNGSEMTFDALAAWSPTNENPSQEQLLATLPDHRTSAMGAE
ncbi:LysR family substrate-binding domain-containing protein [Rhizobium sp. BK376]|uniref:LysR family substrate-binding domain-containing protein n=1 Tax=Rhizobium sp. BK376 TaxID=2512149 RepID=UPI00104E2C88|nr:LysR family substrate-binding domain-containing protein [Rhizobium sp. BK376]